MLTQIISRLSPGGGTDSPWPKRLISLFSMVLSLSCLVMMYGISDSIKKALAV
jgi:hypothetical protein